MESEVHGELEVYIPSFQHFFYQPTLIDHDGSQLRVPGDGGRELWESELEARFWKGDEGWRWSHDIGCLFGRCASADIYEALKSALPSSLPFVDR